MFKLRRLRKLVFRFNADIRSLFSPWSSLLEFCREIMLKENGEIEVYAGVLHHHSYVGGVIEKQLHFSYYFKLLCQIFLLLHPVLVLYVLIVHSVHFTKQLHSKLISFNLFRTVYMFFRSWYRNGYDALNQNKIEP